jgi:hypothetical protein
MKVSHYNLSTNNSPNAHPMKSTFHSVLSQAAVSPIRRGRCLAFAAALTTLRLASAFAQEYDEMNVIPPDDYFDIPTPSINEYVNIGGFQLRVDRTKWGIDLTPNTHALLGRDSQVRIPLTTLPKTWRQQRVHQSILNVFYKLRRPRRKGRLRGQSHLSSARISG